MDYRDAKADTENHVYGRNEDNDDYTLYGAYAQAKFKLEPKLDLFLAGRYDGCNFTSEKTFSPRAALVFKPSPYQNLRFSFNQAANPLPASDLYFDLPIKPFREFLMFGLLEQLIRILLEVTHKLIGSSREFQTRLLLQVFL